jgi:chromosome segregation ATPase
MGNLAQQNSDLNEKLLMTETQLQSFEDEIKTQNQRIQQLEADLQLSESNNREQQEELDTGKSQMEDYLQINKVL